ncbi:SPOCS domain-containing protein [Clostridium sp.]|uniref:SPOCS domain-containing protein n=1 Tax=Clostridium sp. TaxID=1506 RepID=UPI0039922E21
MNKVQRGLIEYNGINSCPKNVLNFKQINIENIFSIPSVKPDMEQLVKVYATGEIIHHEIVETPVGKSLEGQILTGYKLLVSGDIIMKFEYVALEKTQPVHTAHNRFPFCGYIVLPENFNKYSITFPTITIEDIYSEKTDSRCIYNTITMMLSADIC